MTKSFKILAALCLGIICLGIASCKEKNEETEFVNWDARNHVYLDSIATLANSGVGGWKKCLVWHSDSSVLQSNPDITRFVYYRITEEGSGTCSPLWTDSVRVHFLGHLLPSTTYPQGFVFAKTYNGDEVDESTDVPRLFTPSNVTYPQGFVTVIQKMVAGDKAEIVVPYTLGYGAEGSGSVPGYSTLIYEAKLARVYKLSDLYNGLVSTVW